MACKCGEPLVFKLRGQAKEAVEMMAARRGISVNTLMQRLVGNQVFMDEVPDQGGEILCRRTSASNLDKWNFK